MVGTKKPGQERSHAGRPAKVSIRCLQLTLSLVTVAMPECHEKPERLCSHPCHCCRDGYATVTGSSRVLGDLTGASSTGKKEDNYVPRNEKTSELWRPGASFKPTYFNEAKGPKVPTFAHA